MPVLRSRCAKWANRKSAMPPFLRLSSARQVAERDHHTSPAAAAAIPVAVLVKKARFVIMIQVPSCFPLAVACESDLSPD
jgi:hypothetical protein